MLAEAPNQLIKESGAKPRGEQAKYFWPALVLLAGVVSYIPWLGSYGPLDPTDSFFLESGRESIELNQYLLPLNNYVPWLDKPILFFWMVAGSYKLFGINVFAGRLPAALSAILAGLVLYAGCRPMLRRSVAALAAIIFLANPLSSIIGHVCLTDMTLCLFLTGAILFLFKGSRYGSKTDLLIAYTSLGLAVLNKGPIAVILCGLAFFPYFLSISKGIKDFGKNVLSINPVLGVGIVLLLNLPWYIAAAMATNGKFLYTFFWEQNFGRMMGTVNHQGPFWFYIPVYFCGLFPWSLLSLSAPGILKCAWKGFAPFKKRTQAAAGLATENSAPSTSREREEANKSAATAAELNQAAYKSADDAAEEVEAAKKSAGDSAEVSQAANKSADDSAEVNQAANGITDNRAASGSADPQPALTSAKRSQTKPLHNSAAFIRLCTTWFITVIALFSIIKTKLPTYILPAIPAFAILVAVQLPYFFRLSLARKLIPAILISLVVTVGITISPLVLKGYVKEIATSSMWLLGPIALLLSVFWSGLVQSRTRRTTVALAACAMLACGVVVPKGLKVFYKERQVGFSELVLKAKQANASIAMISAEEPSVPWLTHKPVSRLMTDVDAKEFLAKRPAPHYVLIPREMLPRLDWFPAGSTYIAESRKWHLYLVKAQ